MKIIVKGLKAVYTEPSFIPDKDAFDVWFRLLQDMNYETVSAAVAKYMLTGHRPPTVAHIRELATEILTGEKPDWGEAWNEVCRAISRYGFYRPQEAYDSMKPMTRKVVERLGYSNLCLSENPAADRANFRQCYETVLAREREDSMMPDSLRQMIEGIQSNPQLNAPAESRALLSGLQKAFEWKEGSDPQ